MPSHSADCTIGPSTHFCCCDENRIILSPCSSSETLLSLHPTDASTLLLVPRFTVWEPNQEGKRIVSLRQVEDYVFGTLNAQVDITILHFLIYLYATSENSSPNYPISKLKLLHAGKAYSIQETLDIAKRSPLLRDVAQYSTFQMFRTEYLRSLPVTLLASELLQRTSEFYLQSSEDVAVTYAEAIFKTFKKSASFKTQARKKEGPDAKHKFKRAFRIKRLGILV